MFGHKFGLKVELNFEFEYLEKKTKIKIEQEKENWEKKLIWAATLDSGPSPHPIPRGPLNSLSFSMFPRSLARGPPWSGSHQARRGWLLCHHHVGPAWQVLPLARISFPPNPKR